MNMPRYHSSPITGTGKVLAFRTGTRVPAGLRNRVWMIAELERALEQDRLVLHYQPQYDIKTPKKPATMCRNCWHCGHWS